MAYLIKKFIFKLHGEILSKKEIKKRNKNSLENTKCAVIGFTLQGEFIGIFNSFYQASKKTGLHPTKISLCCRRKQKRVKNTIWYYLDKYKSLSTPIANPTPLEYSPPPQTCF